MKAEFLLEKKKGTIEGREIEYYVLRRNLVNGDVLELPIKKEKAQLLSLSLAVENKR